MEQSLFDKYGGFTTVHQVVEGFYDGVLENEILAPYFDDTNMETLIDHQTQFFAAAMGGPASFDDDHLARVHHDRGIGEDAWDSVVTVLSETLSGFDIEPGDIQQILSTVGSKKAFIVQSN
jgi:hemoglobin